MGQVPILDTAKLYPTVLIYCFLRVFIDVYMLVGHSNKKYSMITLSDN
jgi:hypothetical protein